MGFSQALSGLNASTTNLDVIGNNIANSETVGFKSSKALFADVYASAKTGLGVKVADILQDFSTGTLETTGRNLDLAIDGEGFFRLLQNDEVVYSRNGQFTLDEEGFIRNAQGSYLTGFPPGVDTGGNPEALQIPSAALQAQASTSIEAVLNLDSNSPVITDPFDPDDATTYSYANNVTLFDSQGNAHNTTLFFAKVGDNEWDMHLSQNGVDQPAGTLVFDTNGLIDEVNTNLIGVTFDPDDPVAGVDVEDMVLNLDLTGTTQFGGDFELKNANQDGFSSGSLVGFNIDKSGRIIGNYSNEQTRDLGTLAMVNFSNPEGLRPAGDNAWVESTTSGVPLTGLAGTGQFGRIEAGVVENSNVDLTKSLVDMIIAQRAYQANAQTIKTQDEVLQQAVNLR